MNDHSPWCLSAFTITAPHAGTSLGMDYINRLLNVRFFSILSLHWYARCNVRRNIKHINRPTLDPNVAAIICEIWQYWAILEKIFKIHGENRRYWAILGDTGRYQAILGDIRRYWAIWSDIKQYRLYYMGISNVQQYGISMGYNDYSSHSIPLLCIIVEVIHLV